MVTPEERKLSKQVQAHRDATTNLAVKDSSNAKNTTITYVCIPSDSNEAIHEMSFVPRLSEEASSSSSTSAASFTDPLLVHLKDQNVFAGDPSKSIDTSRIQQPSLLSSGNLPNVSEATLQNMAKQASHVETFSLLHPTESNGCTSIQLYLDEIGALKHLPVNPRAAALAERCGYNPPPTFHGDVYVGKKQRNSLQSFHLSDLDGAWLQTAGMSNIEHQMAQNALTGQRDIRQPAVVGTEGAETSSDGNYSWTQTEEELEVQIVLPESISKRNLQVTFRSQQLQVRSKDSDTSGFAPIAITLFERVDSDACTWTIDTSSDGDRTMIITMEKMEEALWPRIQD